MCHDNEDWSKIWRGIDLSVQNWLEKFDKLWPEHSKISKLRLWWDSFIEDRKFMRLKFTGELCVMTIKNDGKFEEELTCQFKSDMRNLTDFDPNTQNL